MGNAYDGFGRIASATKTMGGTARTLTYEYDANGNRLRVTHPDGNFAYYSYDGLDRTTLAWRNGTHGVASYGYDARGQLSGIGAGYSTFLSYDPIGRLAQLQHHPAAAGASVQHDFTRNPAGQLASRSTDNAAYAYANASRSYAVNGLNQYTQVASAGQVTAPIVHNANGSLQSDGTNYFVYDVENRLVASSGVASLGYDPLGRLDRVTQGATTTRFLYDGDRLVAEYDGAGNLLRRYIHGPGVDDPVAWYEGAAMTDANQRLLRANAQGSVTTVANGDTSVILAVNSYDDYGVPRNSANASAAPYGRFGYTGQTWLPELELWYYKGRMYSPTLNRFLQTDPIGYEDGLNWYAYVGNDPVNYADPSGEQAVDGEVVVTGRRLPPPPPPAIFLTIINVARAIASPIVSALTYAVAAQPTACIAMEGCDDPNIMMSINKKREQDSRLSFERKKRKYQKCSPAEGFAKLAINWQNHPYSNSRSRKTRRARV